MRSISEAALARAKDRWNALLREQGSGEVAYASEIFAVAKALKSSIAVSRSLTDPARTGDDRAQLADDVFSGKISGEVLDLLKGLVREHWSSDDDLLTSLDEVGVDSLLASAQRNGRLADVEEELYRVMCSLRDERDLRLAISNRDRSAADREKLVRDVFGSATEETVELLVHAAEQIDDATLAQSLAHYGALAAERNQHMVATVTAAQPLTAEQESRLVSILEQRYGTSVSLHVSLDPSIVGGVRIHIGDDVIDGTLATRLQAVRDDITK